MADVPQGQWGYNTSKAISPEQSCSGQSSSDLMLSASGSSASALFPTEYGYCPAPPFPFSSCSWFQWLVQALCSASRATRWNVCVPFPSKKLKLWNVLCPRVQRAGSATATVYAIFWSLLLDLSLHREGDTYKARSHSHSHLKGLTGLCAKRFASAERAWRGVESCENPGGSNLISSPGA